MTTIEKVRDAVQPAGNPAASVPAAPLQPKPARAPELELYVGHAFNAKSGNFLGMPVFNVTYAEGREVDWGSPSRPITLPDQVFASMTTDYLNVQKTTLMREESDYDMQYSLSVQAEYSGITFSGSASSKYMYHGHLFQRSDASYALNFYCQFICQFKRTTIEASSLTDAFLADLKALPLAADEGRYFAFFDKYGTHYVPTGVMGGTITMEAELLDSAYSRFSDTEISAAVSGGWSGVVASAKLSAEAAYSSLSKFSGSSSATNVTLSVQGGVYTENGPVSAWVQSLYNTPSLLFDVPNDPRGPGSLTLLEPISSLAVVAGVDAAIVKNLIATMETYSASEDYKDGVFTSARQREHNVEISQAADGFLYGYLQSTTDNDAGELSITYQPTDSPNDPPVVAQASQHYYVPGDVWIPAAAFTIPVQKGSSSVATRTNGTGAALDSLRVTSFGNTAEPVLGDWQPISGFTFQAPSDGFIVGSISATSGKYGAIIGGVTENGAFRMLCCAGVDVNGNGGIANVPGNSFCMPVRSGATAQIQSPGGGMTHITLYFVPLVSPYLGLGDYMHRDPGTLYHATTPGMLVATVDAGDAYASRGQIAVYSSNDVQLVNSRDASRALKGRTSAHWYSDDLVWGGSITVPVPARDSYIVDSNPSYGAPTVSCVWVPIVVNKKKQSPSRAVRRAAG
jgi:hypothetical protein